MKLKDALVGFLFWIAILAFVGIVISVDSLPMWILIVLAVLAWIAYILIAIRDREREKRRQPEFYVQTRDGRIIPLSTIKTPQEIYDQEEDE